jgi:hypothetical protein
MRLQAPEAHQALHSILASAAHFWYYFDPISGSGNPTPPHLGRHCDEAYHPFGKLHAFVHERSGPIGIVSDDDLKATA